MEFSGIYITVHFIYVCLYRVYVFSGMYVASVMVVRFG